MITIDQITNSDKFKKLKPEVQEEVIYKYYKKYLKTDVPTDYKKYIKPKIVSPEEWEKGIKEQAPKISWQDQIKLKPVSTSEIKQKRKVQLPDTGSVPGYSKRLSNTTLHTNRIYQKQEKKPKIPGIPAIPVPDVKDVIKKDKKNWQDQIKLKTSSTSEIKQKRKKPPKISISKKISNISPPKIPTKFQIQASTKKSPNRLLSMVTQKEPLIEMGKKLEKKYGKAFKETPGGIKEIPIQQLRGEQYEKAVKDVTKTLAGTAGLWVGLEGAPAIAQGLFKIIPKPAIKFLIKGIGKKATEHIIRHTIPNMISGGLSFGSMATGSELIEKAFEKEYSWKNVIKNIGKSTIGGATFGGIIGEVKPAYNYLKNYDKTFRRKNPLAWAKKELKLKTAKDMEKARARMMKVVKKYHPDITKKAPPEKFYRTKDAYNIIYDYNHKYIAKLKNTVKIKKLPIPKNFIPKNMLQNIEKVSAARNQLQKLQKKTPYDIVKQISKLENKSFNLNNVEDINHIITSYKNLKKADNFKKLLQKNSISLNDIEKRVNKKLNLLNEKDYNLAEKEYNKMLSELKQKQKQELIQQKKEKLNTKIKDIAEPKKKVVEEEVDLEQMPLIKKIKEFGGINPDNIKKLSDWKNIPKGLKLQILKKDGLGADEIAQELNLNVPKDMNPDDYLLQQIQNEWNNKDLYKGETFTIPERREIVRLDTATIDDKINKLKKMLQKVTTGRKQQIQKKIKLLESEKAKQIENFKQNNKKVLTEINNINDKLKQLKSEIENNMYADLENLSEPTANLNNELSDIEKEYNKLLNKKYELLKQVNPVTSDVKKQFQEIEKVKQEIQKSDKLKEIRDKIEEYKSRGEKPPDTLIDELKAVQGRKGVKGGPTRRAGKEQGPRKQVWTDEERVKNAPTEKIKGEAKKYKNGKEFYQRLPEKYRDQLRNLGIKGEEQFIKFWEDATGKKSSYTYQMSHRPTKTGAIASDITKNGIIPKDFYSHPEYYFNMSEKTHQESFSVLKKIKGKPNAEITIYRASPEKELNYGDWVSLSKEYAKQEGLHPTDPAKNMPVHSYKVKAKDIQFAGDDINEFGYYPPEKIKKISNKAQKNLYNNNKGKKSFPAVFDNKNIPSDARFDKETGLLHSSTYNKYYKNNDTPQLSMDIDNGGTINKLNEAFFDRVIKKTGEIINKVTKGNPDKFGARKGGEEFVVINGSEADANKINELLRQEKFELDNLSKKHIDEWIEYYKEKQVDKFKKVFGNKAPGNVKELNLFKYRITSDTKHPGKYKITITDITLSGGIGDGADISDLAMQRAKQTKWRGGVVKSEKQLDKAVKEDILKERGGGQNDRRRNEEKNKGSSKKRKGGMDSNTQRAPERGGHDRRGVGQTDGLGSGQNGKDYTGQVSERVGSGDGVRFRGQDSGSIGQGLTREGKRYRDEIPVPEAEELPNHIKRLINENFEFVQEYDPELWDKVQSIMEDDPVEGYSILMDEYLDKTTGGNFLSRDVYKARNLKEKPQLVIDDKNLRYVNKIGGNSYGDIEIRKTSKRIKEVLVEELTAKGVPKVEIDTLGYRTVGGNYAIVGLEKYLTPDEIEKLADKIKEKVTKKVKIQIPNLNVKDINPVDKEHLDVLGIKITETPNNSVELKNFKVEGEYLPQGKTEAWETEQLGKKVAEMRAERLKAEKEMVRGAAEEGAAGKEWPDYFSFIPPGQLKLRKIKIEPKYAPEIVEAIGSKKEITPDDEEILARAIKYLGLDKKRYDGNILNKNPKSKIEAETEKEVKEGEKAEKDIKGYIYEKKPAESLKTLSDLKNYLEGTKEIKEIEDLKPDNIVVRELKRAKAMLSFINKLETSGNLTPPEQNVIIDWIGNKQWTDTKAEVLKNKIKDELREELKKIENKVEGIKLKSIVFIKKGGKVYSYTKNDLIDMAMREYIDLKNDPEAIKKYIDNENVSKFTKYIVKLSQMLPEGIKRIADKYEKEMYKFGEIAQESGLISNLREHYVYRAYKNRRPYYTGFATSTGHAQQRLYKTELEAEAGGNKPIPFRLSDAVGNTMKDTMKVLYDRNLKAEMENTLYDIDEETGEKQYLFDTKKWEGYKKLEHPGFRKYEFYKKLDIKDPIKFENEKKIAYLEGYIVKDDGTVLKAKPLYAPANIATYLNNVLMPSKLREIPGVRDVAKLNQTIKNVILKSSLFHPITLSLQNYLIQSIKNPALKIPYVAYKRGYKEIQQLSPAIEYLVKKGGLTLGGVRDIEVPGNIPESRYVYFVFQKYAPGLKASYALHYFRKALKKYKAKKISKNEFDALVKIYSQQANEVFGGLNIERQGVNKGLWDAMKLIIFSPDWTISNYMSFIKLLPIRKEAQRFMVKQIKAGNSMDKTLKLLEEETKKRGWRLDVRGMLSYWRMFLNAFATLAGTSMLGNMVINGKIAPDNVDILHRLDIEITGLVKKLNPKNRKKLLGKFVIYNKGNRYFIRIGTTFLDPVRYAIKPIQTVYGKSSVILRAMATLMTGVNWNNQPYKSVKEWKRTGIYLGRSGERPKKSWSTMPAWMYDRIITSMPIQLQSFYEFLQGEADGFFSLARMAGLPVYRGYKKRVKRKKYNPFKSGYNRIKRNRTWQEQLKF